jgi:anti-sigma regulatory factor (Ser/Thr protein kinase)
VNPSKASEQFLPVPPAVGAARRFVDRTLAAWDVVGGRDDAMLVVSELATNAVRHAGSPFRVSVMRRAGQVRISVRDIGRGGPTVRSATAASTSGRGLALVAAVSSSWGVEPEADGKVVWADVAA